MRLEVDTMLLERAFELWLENQMKKDKPALMNLAGTSISVEQMLKEIRQGSEFAKDQLQELVNAVATLFLPDSQSEADHKTGESNLPVSWREDS